MRNSLCRRLALIERRLSPPESNPLLIIVHSLPEGTEMNLRPGQRIALEYHFQNELLIEASELILPVRTDEGESRYALHRE